MRTLTVWLARAAAILLFVSLWGSGASAQCIFSIALVCPPPAATDGNVHSSGNAASLDVGSKFLQRLGALPSFKSAASAGNNPQGGGADAPEERYRTWFEGYGLTTRTDTQGDFLGDRRRAFGGVAGAAWTFAPGATVGLSVDQSQTRIDVSGIAQNARIDLTQVGVNGAFEHGRWTLGTAFIHGFGTVRTGRTEFGGESVASYNARLWGAMAELSYYWSLPNGNSRVVPKLTVDWMRSRTGSFAETGGVDPVSGASVTATRFRLLAGAEIGHTWLVDRKMFDVSAYGRLVDNLHQDMGTLQITSPFGSAAIAGIRESTYGADAGATLSAKITEIARFYAVYDGRYRSHFIAHSGTLGVEIKW